MQAKIYKPTKSTMQSGHFNKNIWILEFLEQNGSRYIDSSIGWTSQIDMQQEVKLEFNSKEEAEQFAKSNNISYVLSLPSEKKYIKKAMPIISDEDQYKIFLIGINSKDPSDKYDIFVDKKLGLFTDFILSFHQYIDSYQLNGDFLVHILVQKNYPIEYLHALNLIGSNMSLRNYLGFQAADLANYGSDVRNYLLSFENHTQSLLSVDSNIDITEYMDSSDNDQPEEPIEPYTLQLDKFSGADAAFFYFFGI